MVHAGPEEAGLAGAHLAPDREALFHVIVAAEGSGSVESADCVRISDRAARGRVRPRLDAVGGRPPRGSRRLRPCSPVAARGRARVASGEGSGIPPWPIWASSRPYAYAETP